MAKDNRVVHRAIWLGEDERKAKGVSMLTDEDDISAFYTQEQLDAFVANGTLSGDWKSTFVAPKTGK